MFLLVPAHLGSPGQSPGGRKMVVVVVEVVTSDCTDRTSLAKTYSC